MTYIEYIHIWGRRLFGHIRNLHYCTGQPGQARTPLPSVLQSYNVSVFLMDLWGAVLNTSAVEQSAFNPSEGRKYVVYSEVESEPACESSGAISTFTFLNFVASSISLAGNLGSNSNSNNNNNNNNDNNNNNNDNNINIGNNNNNANSGNTIMFIPMMGRRSTLGEHPYSTTVRDICHRHHSGQSGLSLVAMSSVHVFHHLSACKQSLSCDKIRICSIITSALSWIPPNKNIRRLQTHLLKGALLLTLGLKAEDFSCQDSRL